MADYPILPATLAALNATVTDPAEAEDAAKLAASVRQTRRFVFDYLTLFFDDSTHSLKPAAIGGGTIPTGSVRGTNPATHVQREIVQGSVQTEDLADLASTTIKVADAAITSAKLAALSVQTAHVQAKAITTDKISDAAITGQQIAPGAVTGDKVGSSTLPAGAFVAGAVAEADLADRSVTGGKLPEMPEGYILVGGNGSDGRTAAVMPLSGAIVVDKSGIATFVASFGNSVATSFSRVSEKTGVNTTGGQSSGGPPSSWMERGLTARWHIDEDPNSQLRVNGSKIEFLKDGVYWIDCWVCGYTDSFRGRLEMCTDASKPTDTTLVYSASAYNNVAVNTWTRVTTIAKFTFGAGKTATTATSRPWFKLTSCHDANTADNMGKACNLVIEEIYSHLTVYRLGSI